MEEARPTVPRGIIKLAVLNALCFVSFAIITPVLDQLIRQPFNVDNSGTAKFMAIHGVATLIFGVVAGVMSDKIGRRIPIIIVGLIGSGITTALIPHIGDFNLLLGVRFVDGMFGALALGLLITRALDLADATTRNRTMGVMSIAISSGFLIAPTLTALLAETSLRLLFGLVGSTLILGGIWMMGDLGQAESVSPLSGGPRAILRAFYSRPRLAVPILFAFVDKFTFGTFAHLTALAVVDLFGLGTRAASFVILGFWIAFTVTAVPGSRLCDRFGSLKVLIAGSALYGCTLVGLGLMNFTGFSLLMVLAGVFCAIQYVPSISLIGEYSDPLQRGISTGVWNMAGSMGIVAGMVLSGKLSEQSYALAYGTAGVLEIICATIGVIAYFLIKRDQEKLSSD